MRFATRAPCHFAIESTYDAYGEAVPVDWLRGLRERFFVVIDLCVHGDSFSW
jgi:hypothetical protein